MRSGIAPLLAALALASSAPAASPAPPLRRATFNISAAAAVADAAGAAVAGELLLFAGGKGAAAESADVTAYSAGAGWTTHRGVLSGARAQMASTALPDGSVAMFAGGEDAQKMKFGGVDVYTASTGQWSSLNLSQPRSFLAAASLVTSDARALSVFAGGEISEGNAGTDSGRVDIYQHRKGWIVNADLLSVKRKKLAAASAGDYVLIGGGYTSGAKGSASRGYRDEVDLFHASDGALGSLDLMNAR